MQDLVIPAAASIVLVILWAAEGVAPLFVGREHRTAHGLRNTTLGVTNGLLRAAFFPPLLLGLTLLCEDRGIGLLHLAALPLWASLIAAVLLLDLWHYLWHILWHKVPFFWRFHVVHHHDPEVDATTAFRFHTGEILLSCAALALAVPLFGVTILEIVAFETILVATALFHHANVNLPAGLDRAIRLVIVTPRMHWVHHSRWEPETDSNYSAIFSFWDRMFGTYRVREDIRSLELGLDGYEPRDTDTLTGMFKTPLGPVKSTSGRPPVVSRAAAVATPATDPANGRQLPLPLAVAAKTTFPKERPEAVVSGPTVVSGPNRRASLAESR